MKRWDRRQVAASQPPLTRFDGPRHLYALGPQDHPLNLKLEATYGYFALEPALYDEYTDAIERNAKLRDGLNVSRILNMTTGSPDSNPSVLPRAYFPKAVADVSSLAESRQALETLDPRAQSVCFCRTAPSGRTRPPRHPSSPTTSSRTASAITPLRRVC